MALTRAAMIQFSGSSEKERNIEKARRFVGEAAANGAKIVCLQELFNTIYFCFEENPAHYALAEPIDGPTVEAMCDLAAEHGIVLVAPIYEKEIKGELYNTAVVIDPQGEIMGIYRKSSIPMVKTASLFGSEKYYFKPGNTGFPVWQTPFGVNIGVMICYDRHFPEHARLLALNGADLVFVPTATCGMSRYLWEIELQAHAIDNIYYVGGVNRVGKDDGGSPDQHYYGSSFFTSPKGEILAQAGDQDDEIVYADIDTGLIEQLRNEWGFFRDRRPDLYADLAE
ncbi:MAG: nitrilase-related carbon-nitrogen hydrolase [Thermoleophilia bacterium]